MKGYLFCNTPDIVKNSSSGGAFTAVVNTVVQEYDTDVVIYGAAFDENLNVIHKRFDARSDYSSLRGSKYVFSEYNKTLPLVREDLCKGTYVIFTGTPCQVYALKAFLNKAQININNLLTIDVICHGAPDAKIWNAYKAWLENRYKKKIKNFTFRYKGARWHGYSLMVEFEDGKKIVNSHELQVYMDLYFTNQVMRKSCYYCQFASVQRPGDITLGDFWGAERVFPKIVTPEMKKQGISLLIHNSEKGLEIVNRMKQATSKNSWIMHECKDDSFAAYQTGFNAPVDKPLDNDQFCHYMTENNLFSVFKKYAGFNLKGRIRYCIKYMANYLGLIK